MKNILIGVFSAFAMQLAKSNDFTCNRSILFRVESIKSFQTNGSEPCLITTSLVPLLSSALKRNIPESLRRVLIFSRRKEATYRYPERKFDPSEQNSKARLGTLMKRHENLAVSLLSIFSGSWILWIAFTISAAITFLHQSYEDKLENGKVNKLCQPKPEVCDMTPIIILQTFVLPSQCYIVDFAIKWYVFQPFPANAF